MKFTCLVFVLKKVCVLQAKSFSNKNKKTSFKPPKNTTN